MVGHEDDRKSKALFECRVNCMGGIESVYTDGACSGNPGPGGWGVVVYFKDGIVHELGGGESLTTNNRMEMQAAIAALEFLASSGCTESVSLYTDSEYVKNGITKWIKGWKKKGWKTSTGKAVLNQDLWVILDELASRVGQQLSNPLQWCYVRGHSGNAGNERCDTIARAFASGQSPALRSLSLGQLTNTASESDQFSSETTDKGDGDRLKSGQTALFPVDSAEPTMSDLIAAPNDLLEHLPREMRVNQLRNLLETLQIADEIASKGYLISSSELADLMDINASAVTSRGDHWVWRNWVVSRVRREGNQILWQLERVD